MLILTFSRSSYLTPISKIRFRVAWSNETWCDVWRQSYDVVFCGIGMKSTLYGSPPVSAIGLTPSRPLSIYRWFVQRLNSSAPTGKVALLILPLLL